MIVKLLHRNKLRKIVTILCVVGMLVASMPHPITEVSAQGGSEPERSRSNHDTQIKVLGPSNVRINTWNGNLFYPVSILTIPGRGLSIEIYMSYNSSWHDFATHYGYGWQLSYNMSYVRDENGDITIVWGDGSTDRFVNDNGSYLSPVDTYDTLQEYEPDKYVLRTKHGLEFYFDSPIHKRLTKMQDPNGNVLNFAYDADMLLTTITDASGRQVNLTYTDDNLTSITDPNTTPSRSVQFEYDANDNLISIVDLEENATNYGYDAEHYLTSIAPPCGVPTTITYSDGAVTNVTGELTSKSFSYDTGNRITIMTDSAPEGDQITRFFYDTDGRITSIEDPLTNSVWVTWDESNNLTSFTDQNNNQTMYEYDAKGNLLSVTDALSNTTSYTYEGTYNKVTSVTNANVYTTTYDYDSRGNLVSEEDPLGHTTVYTYNSVGDLISRTDANDAATTYDYDDHGNLTTVTYPLGVVSYSYDAVGNMTGMTNTHVSVLYTYDALNRVTNVDYVSHGKSISYVYDAMGNRTHMTDPNDGDTTYSYDDANRLASLTNPLSQTTSYTYDSRGRLTRKDYHNGTYTTYQYDQANRLLSLVNSKSSGEVIVSYTYEYDAAGNRTRMTEANGDETTYGYDDLYQLTSVTYPDDSTVEYAYDTIGNRLVLTDTTGTTDYSYDDADRLQTAGTVTYNWDDNGNLIRKIDGSDIAIYDYDYENRVISITFPDSSTNSFTYYPDGRRLSKTDISGEKTHYFYDGPNAIVEANNVGATIARYTSGLGVDEWISMDRDGSSYYYHQDGLGSVIGLTNPSETVVATYQYDVFGAIRSQTGGIVNPCRFAGREYDEENGLYYYKLRYYDSQVGRFISQDLSPGYVNEPLSLNRFLYVNNNPVNFVDPLGDKRIKIETELFGRTITFDTNVRYSRGRIYFDGEIRIDGKPAGTFSGTYRRDAPTPQDNKGVFPGGVYRPRGNGGNNSGGHGTGGGSPGGGGGTGGGSGGGIESKPLDVVPSAFLGDTSADSLLVPQPQAEPLVTLKDIMPTIGPPGTTAVPVTPKEVFGGTQVVDAAAIDFIEGETSLTKAAILATTTITDVYDHDYSVCGRFHGYTLESASAQPFPDLLPGLTETPWFWHMSAHKDDLVEEALVFIAIVDEDQRTFTIDSRWLWDYYQGSLPANLDYIFNFHIWATSAEESYKLLRRTLENLTNFDGGSWTISFANTTEPASPTVLIKSADYSDNEIVMDVQSWLPTTQTVDFDVHARQYISGTTPFTLEFTRTLEPGVNAVTLPVEDILDAVVLVWDDGLFDKVYVGSGFWFVFSDDQSVGIKNDLLCDETDFNEEALVLQGCAQMTGTITTTYGYVGLARTLNPNGRPVDVSDYQALTFKAKGDGKSYQVKLETDAVKDYDYHQFVFTPPFDEWRQYIIPFSLFKQQGWGTPVPFTATDVKSVAWVSVGPHCDDDSVQLDIDRVAFINSLIVSDATGPTSTNDVFGPYTITTEINDNVGVETATLYYSVNGGDFVEVAMTGDGGIFSGQIPGQSMGSEVRYYIEAGDADGNVATDPVDAPYTTHHFRVEWYPSLLVDDFSDRNPYNVLGGWSGIFRDPDEGGVITPCYDGHVLRLTFDVTDHIPEPEWAGYYSKLEQADLRPYNSIVLQVKGDNSGERVKIGLNDGLGHEPKIELSEYLPNGITTDWQTATIPLNAFAPIIDWLAMDNFNLTAEESISSGSGTIYVDDVNFEPDAWPIQLDNFNDLDNQNGVGLLHDTDVGGGASMVVGYDQTNPYGGAGASLALTYNVPGDAFAAWHSGLGGLDVSSYDKLAFAVRGASGEENFHVWLVDQAGHYGWVEVISYTTVVDTWPSTPVEIPLQDFATKGVDLTQLSLFKVAFEWEPMNGIVYLDDIRFTLPPSPTITALSPVAATNDVSTTLTLTGTNFLMYPTVALDYNLLKNVTWPSSTTLTATIPPGIAAGVYDLWVIQPNMQFGVMNDAFTMDNVYSLMVTPATDAKSGDPGTTVTYTLQVTNTGSTTDVYTVTVSDNVWTTTAPGTIGPLAVGDSATVDVTVSIPPSTAGGTTDTATIIVTSQGDSTKWATATLTTTAKVSDLSYNLFLPLILKGYPPK